MIRAVVCDFGGVLTTPLQGSFQAFADASGIPLEAIAEALVAIHERDGVHPLHELECGRVSEPDFMADVATTLAGALAATSRCTTSPRATSPAWSPTRR